MTVSAPSIIEVTFAESGKIVRTDGCTTLLELAEEHGIEMQFGCRGGGCGCCKVLCQSGDVEMACSDGLCSIDQSLGFVLSCMGCPRTNCVVQA